MNTKLKSTLKLLKRAVHTKIKYPIDPEHANEIPVSQYITTPHNRRRMYVWGNVRTGALGVPYKNPKNNVEIELLRVPIRHNFAERNFVTNVSCGFGFTILARKVDNSFKFYGTGLNTDSQIGYHEVRQEHHLGVLFFPREINLQFKNPESVIVKKISAGRAHSAILTNEGLFTLGNNSYGQCGRRIVQREDYSQTSYVNHITSIENKEIIDVECGQDHTMVITEDGKVYSCGWSADGQTGLGHFDCQDKFTEVKGDIEGEIIVKLSCRSDFVLALNDNHQVFGWGNIEYAQMTMPDGSQQLADPTHIKMLENLGEIKTIATGGTSCLVLNSGGEVFVWGFGLLGVGPNVQESRVPIEIPPQLFGSNEFKMDSEVIDIASGLGHMLAITGTGDLYAWGRNRSSCLGLGHEKDQYYPLRVAIGAYVKKVHCGLDHTVAICNSYLSENEGEAEVLM